MPDSQPSLTPLTFHVLLSLSGGATHGYAIGKQVEERSRGRLLPTTGALYQALRRLLEDGLIDLAPAPDDNTDARRRYYRITEPGRQAAAAEAASLAELVEAARNNNLLPQQP